MNKSIIKIHVPNTRKELSFLEAGQQVFLSGSIYTARDQAHKKLAHLIGQRRRLPLNLKNQIIYYCGPTPSRPGKVIGSCGPTSASRMDVFLEPLLQQGLSGMIGKGRRSPRARKLIKKYNAVYFMAPAGCGALLAQTVLSKKLIAFPELGPEAIYRLEVEDLPLIVAIDSRGKSIYSDIEEKGY